MKLIDSAIRAFAPSLALTTEWMREELVRCGVTVHLSDGCLEALASNARDAARRTHTADEPHVACVKRQIAARARFVQLWTGTDEKFDRAEWNELIEICRRYVLPRPWKVSEPVAREVSEVSTG
ncbi:MAG TPA: hypothetical protein VMU67_03070 [Steroidobacteraceae bacterium]|nr:hypothetical protein [Steroidobacteraceae bacterium]